MKKVLSLAFIAAVILLGCSADGFYDGNPQQINPQQIVWSQRCLTANGCVDVQSSDECVKPDKLVLRSECPKN